MAIAEPPVNWRVRATLEERLRDWAREYSGPIIIGGSGDHILDKLIEFGGFLPGSTAPRNQVDPTPADQVEAVVRRMQEGFPAHARVLRCDYFARDIAMENRLDRLRSMGHKMSRAGYYNHLESAKLYVAGSL